MQQEEKSKKRTSIGKISGIVGIFCNCILAGSKIIIGNLAGSMSIAADGLNNLSDAASSIVTLIGFKIAEKAGRQSASLWACPLRISGKSDGRCDDLIYRL